MDEIAKKWAANNAAAAAKQKAIYTNQSPATEQPPREPQLRVRANELLGYLQRLTEAQGQLRTILFGPYAQELQGGEVKNPHEPSLEELLSRACGLAACCVGESVTILEKL